MYGPAKTKIECFGGNIEFQHPLGDGGNGVFPGVMVTMPDGTQNWLQLQPKGNGGWTARIVESPALDLIAFGNGGQHRVEISGGAITVYDAANTVMFQVP